MSVQAAHRDHAAWGKQIKAVALLQHSPSELVTVLLSFIADAHSQNITLLRHLWQYAPTATSGAGALSLSLVVAAGHFGGRHGVLTGCSQLVYYGDLIGNIGGGHLSAGLLVASIALCWRL